MDHDLHGRHIAGAAVSAYNKTLYCKNGIRRFPGKIDHSVINGPTGYHSVFDDRIFAVQGIHDYCALIVTSLLDGQLICIFIKQDLRRSFLSSEHLFQGKNTVLCILFKDLFHLIR